MSQQILTFDDQGISGHPNHKSLPEGVKHLLKQYNYTSAYPRPRLFTLTTHPVGAKYNAILAPIYGKLVLYGAQVFDELDDLLLRVAHNFGFGNTWMRRSDAGIARRTSPVFISGIREYLTALRAMRQHQSQLVWFRWLYVSFSRYMWINEWVEVIVPGLA